MSRLRVFVSSTMNDLPNERDAVVQKLNAYNLESVNAEDFAPTGQSSWDLLSDEIRSSNIFILILGSRYGWVPSTGPHAASKLSVTEIEYLEARAANIPVLPFFSELHYGADSTSDDARLRDRFRREVSDWDGGLFRQDYRLASDLAEKVGLSIANLFAKRFHESTKQPPASAPTPAAPVATGTHDELAVLLRTRPTIFAGSGVSLAAGLPSAQLMMDGMLGAIKEVDTDYVIPVSGTAFNVLATDLEIARGRGDLEQLAQELLSPAGAVGQSEFHAAALGLSDLIITTNYDMLFEQSGDGRSRVITELEDDAELPDRALVKFHGTLDIPRSLVLNEADLFEVMTRRPRLTAKLAEAISSAPMLVIGSSLRDPSVLGLLEQAQSLTGLFVSPSISQSERRRISSLGLIPVEVSWDQILETLRDAQHASD